LRAGAPPQPLREAELGGGAGKDQFPERGSSASMSWSRNGQHAGERPIRTVLPNTLAGMVRSRCFWEQIHAGPVSRAGSHWGCHHGKSLTALRPGRPGGAQSISFAICLGKPGVAVEHLLGQEQLRLRRFQLPERLGAVPPSRTPGSSAMPNCRGTASLWRASPAGSTGHCPKAAATGWSAGCPNA